MLRRLPKFEYLAPTILKKAISLLEEHGEEAKVLAGGTDLLVSMKKRALKPRYVVDIKGIPDLDYIRYEEGVGLRIGALATLQAVVKSPLTRDVFDLVAQGALAMHIIQVRNRGTVAGNLCNASPSADMAPALLALGARVKLEGPKGERMVALEDFFVGPFATVLGRGELLTEIQVPTPPPKSRGSYQWLPKITTADETLVGAAVLLTRDGDGVCREVRIALGSVAPTPIRAKKAEDALRGNRIEESLLREVGSIAASETCPRSRADYRCEMTKVFVQRALRQAARV